MEVGVRSVPKLGDVKTARELGLNQKQGRRQFVWVGCPGCGKERWVAKGEHPRYCQPCYYENSRDYRLENHPNWKGGVRIVRGYRDIKVSLDSKFYSMTTKNGYIREHRYVMANHLDRLLKPEEIVHHLNGIRDDNRIANLTITGRDKHEHYTLLKVMQERIRELEIITLHGTSKKRVSVTV